MRVVADEDVAAQIVEALRADGHEVTYLAELAPSTEDPVVLSWANTASSLLITSDKDFGELVYRSGEQTCGVLLLRLHQLQVPTRAALVASVLRQRGSELSRSFAVLTPAVLRVRPKS